MQLLCRPIAYNRPIIIVYISEKQAVKGEALSAPKEKGSQEKKSRGEVVPPIAPITAAAFPLHCDGQTLL